jgi:plastocyanin
MKRIALAFAVLPLLLAGCSQENAGVTPPMDDEGRYVIRMTSELTFDPARASVPSGATVVWVNEATMPHDVAGYEGDPIKSDFSDFSSSDPPPGGHGALIPPGGQYNHTFAKDGPWTIWCHTHHEERMKGIILVG